MMEEIKKSISSILYERTTSPLFGTLIISWVIWNWKILYVTFFVSEKITKNKIDFIVLNYSDIHHIVTFPLISTFALLTIVPFISNGAYWLSINFENWKLNQKNSIEKKQLLTVEQSIELREQILKQEERFSKLVQDKNLEIERLTNLIENTNNASESNDILNQDNEEELEKLSIRIKNNDDELEAFNYIMRRIQSGLILQNTGGNTTIKVVALLESYNLINKPNTNLYQFTERGKKFLRLMSE
jgi:hypothetical protein